MTSSTSPKIPQIQSPSHYSNRAREKRCTRAKELLVDLIKAQTTHHVDPKDVKTTKPSSGVSWRFEVDPGIEFPFVQLSSISRPNLDLLEKAVEGGGVRVVWMTENELSRTSTDEAVGRPRKRTKHSADSDAQIQVDSENSQSQQSSSTQSTQQQLPHQTFALPLASQAPPIPPPPGAGPSTSFTTVNGPPPQLNTNHIQPIHPHLASQTSNNPAQAATATTISNDTSPASSSSTQNISTTSISSTSTLFAESTVTVEIPRSCIARLLAQEHNLLNESLQSQNTILKADLERMKTEIATIQSKYNTLEEQLRKKMSQIQDILQEKRAGDDCEAGGGGGGSGSKV